MSQLNQVKRDNSPDQVYYDVTITNFQSQNTLPPVFYYNEARTIPFINCPEDYYLSIIRFTVDTGTLPVWIPSIVPFSTNPNETIYNITLTYDDGTTNFTSGAIPLIFIPQDRTTGNTPAPPSTTSNGLQINDTGYYNVYSYQYIAYLITETFKTALASLVNQVVTLGGSTMPVYKIYTQNQPNPPAVNSITTLDSTDLPPLFQWDTSSDTGSIFTIPQYDLNPDVNSPTGFSGNNPIKIFFNAPMFYLFQSFPATIFGYSAVGGNENFQIDVINQGGLNTQLITPPQYDVVNSAWQYSGTPLPPLSIPYISTYQETSTIGSLSPITAIVFTSNTMPITPNQVSTPLVLFNNQQIGFQGNNADIANIITDLVSSTGAYRPSLVYEPQAQYRLVTLNGNRPLFNLDLQVFYRLRNGSLVPFRLASGGSVTIKIAFLKKDSVGATTAKDPLAHYSPAFSGNGATKGGRRMC
jgi:hypothetical protein